MTIRSDTAMLAPFMGLPEGRALVHAYWLAINRRERDLQLRHARESLNPVARARHVVNAKFRHRDMLSGLRDLRASLARLSRSDAAICIIDNEHPARLRRTCEVSP